MKNVDLLAIFSINSMDNYYKINTREVKIRVGKNTRHKHGARTRGERVNDWSRKSE